MCDCPPFYICVFCQKKCIGWAIGAPGHGKYLVDGKNSYDKQHMNRYMKRVIQPHEGDKERNIKPYLIDQKKLVSLDDECRRHCFKG